MLVTDDRMLRRAVLLATLLAPLVFILVAWPALDENSGTYDEPFLVTAGWCR